jgi:hypothetical protein
MSDSLPSEAIWRVEMQVRQLLLGVEGRGLSLVG